MKRSVVLLLALTACQAQIQHGLDESQANEIETLLTQAGIEAHKVSEGGREAKWAIAVPPERTTAAIKLLNDHDLPRQRAPGFGEVFGKGSMVPTAVEENALFIHALSGEVARTLSSIDGVVNARVHIVANTVSLVPGQRPPVKPRASVLLKVVNGQAASIQARSSEVQALVAGSVEGLEPASVSIMISELPAAPEPARLPPPRASRTPLLAAVLAVAGLAGAVAALGLALRRSRVDSNTRPGQVEAETARTAA